MTHRNAKQLQAKSRRHQVTRLSDTHYKVLSISGSIYHVNPLTLRCTCPYGTHRPSQDKRSGCSHLISVLSHIKEMEEERRLMVCASEEEALRSKRSLAGGFDGLILLSRVTR